MLDLKALRQDSELFTRQLHRKEPSADVQLLLALDQRARELKTEVEQLKASRNARSKQIGELKRQGLPCEELMNEVNRSAERVEELDRELAAAEERLHHELASLPNLPANDVPDGPDRHSNVCEYQEGHPPAFEFPFKNHVELNEGLQLFDFKRSAKTTGSGWPAYCGLGARLEWALINLMIDTHVERGYTMWMPPLLVREPIEFASGQLPKFANQQFKLTDEEFPLYLIPTAEVVLNGLYSGEMLPAEELPLRLCAYTPCFRREAGAAGSAERGLIRMHQFNKVEMFAFCLPQQSDAMFQELVEGAELVLRKLGLHFKRMLLCTGDMSFAAAKTVDIEVWLPGQGRYYEVSSISNCTDFQSRRSQTRSKGSDGKPVLLHTLNGSGLATSRLMVALLENYQRSDGSVVIPEALRPYLNGLEVIEPATALRS
jgi:seryl-tRNA synthetase